MTPQKSFGEFTTERFGPNWVYAARSTEALRGKYGAVITPKQQRQLAADYKAQWGRERDAEFWTMICALRQIQGHAACPAVIEALASGALKVAGVAL